MEKIYFIDESIDRMGGVERVISTLSNELVNDYDINIISLFKSKDKPHFTYNEKINIKFLIDVSNLKSKKYKNIKPIYLVFRLFEKFNVFIKTKTLCKRYAKEIKSNDIVVFGRVDTALEFLPYIKDAKKIIVREAIHLYYHKKQKKLKKYFEKKVNTFIISSEENKNIYNLFFNKKIDMRKIYNPLGIVPKINTDLDKKIVVAVGRYDTHKGYDYLISSWIKVKEKHPDWTLKIIGDGYYKPKMEQMIKENNLNNEVILVPTTKDIVSELNNASIFVMASRFEGYANSLVEAMACGLPCISYNWLVGVNEIIDNKKNGIIVGLEDRFKYFKALNKNQKDIDNMSNAIINLIEDPKLRKSIGKEACKIIESRNKDDIINIWRNIILR